MVSFFPLNDSILFWSIIYLFLGIADNLVRRDDGFVDQGAV